MKQIQRKDGVVYTRQDKRGKETIPSKLQYIDIIKDLTTKKEWDVLLVVRMGCEMGMSRQDIVNAEIQNIDRYHPRGLWIETSKRVKRKGKYEMRSREVPINSSLYSFMQNYIEKDSKYILKRKKGNILKPNSEQKINELYTKGNIPWSPHKSRHYFRTQLKMWMRQQRSVDEELVDSLMGHQPKEAREMYGVIDWSYKQEVIDKVF